MTVPGRSKVIWLGANAPAGLVDEFRRRGMSIVPKLPAAFDPKAADIRAVLVPFHANTQVLRNELSHAASAVDLGALVILVIDTDTHAAAANLAASGIGPKEEFRVRTLNSQRPHELTRLCSDHDPGRSIKIDLGIDDPDNCLAPLHKLLLARAFNDFHRIVVRRLSGGRSGATGVWRISAFDQQDWECEPFAVKAGPRKAIEEETNATLNNVAEYVPFPHRPPIAIDRCVKGLKEALIVSMFIDRVTRFEEYVLMGSPSLAVSALFDGPLRTWRRNRRAAERIQLATEYMKCGIVPKGPRIAELTEAFEQARLLTPDVTTPPELVNQLALLPKATVDVCFPHGDLQARNIFVRRNSSDIILIDFSGAKSPGPAARDLAALDVALAIDVTNKAGSFLEPNMIRAIYTRPLWEVPRSCKEDSRVEAIAQLRMHARGEGIKSLEYELSITCHLLRFARYSVPPDAKDPGAYLKHKGVVYDVAARLLQALKGLVQRRAYSLWDRAKRPEGTRDDGMPWAEFFWHQAETGFFNTGDAFEEF